MAEQQKHTPVRGTLSVDQYYDGVVAGNVAVVARALTLIESNNLAHQQLAEELLSRLAPHTGSAVRVGITGAPGVGKSTFIEALGVHLVRSGRRIAVLAVDPSSGVSGGSILGDKTRMPELSNEPNAYIRPSPSSGALGGVGNKTRECLLVCEAAGYDIVLVETVGVGQSETMVAEMTDCFLALMIPGAGDELQGIKRGLLEFVDVVAVNKADGDTARAAESAALQYDVAFKSLSGVSQTEMAPEVLTCSALHRRGVVEVWSAIERRYASRRKSGALAVHRGQQNLRWLWRLVEQKIHQSIREHASALGLVDDLEKSVVAGMTSPRVAARQILEAFDFGSHGVKRNKDV